MLPRVLYTLLVVAALIAAMILKLCVLGSDEVGIEMTAPAVIMSPPDRSYRVTITEEPVTFDKEHAVHVHVEMDDKGVTTVMDWSGPASAINIDSNKRLWSADLWGDITLKDQQDKLYPAHLYLHIRGKLLQSSNHGYLLTEPHFGPLWLHSDGDYFVAEATGYVLFYKEPFESVDFNGSPAALWLYHNHWELAEVPQAR